MAGRAGDIEHAPSVDPTARKQKRWFLAYFVKQCLSVVMDMNLQQLRMLCEVSRLGTIAAAAESLGYSASAVSQQLNGLEKSTGVPMTERVGRNVRITDAGRELVRHANELLAGLEAAQVAVERVNKQVAGELCIAVYETVAGTLLPPLLHDLADRYPDLLVRTRELEPVHAMTELDNGDVDLAFTIEYRHLATVLPKGVEAKSLIEDPFYLAVPEGDSIGNSRVSIGAIADRVMIAPPGWSSCGECVVAACRTAGFEPDIYHEVDDYRTLMRLCAAGLGVGLVPELALIDMPPGIRMVEIWPPVTRTVQLAHRSASSGRPAITAVHESLDRVIAKLGLRASQAA